MKEVWAHVPKNHKNGFDFDDAYEEAQIETILPAAKKEIFDTDSNGVHDRLQNNMRSAQDWDTVRAELQAKGLDFAKTDFTYAKGAEYPNLAYSGIIKHLEKVLDILDDVGEPMTQEDWLTVLKGTDNTMLEEVLDSSDADTTLEAIFAPRRWAGKIEEMNELWSLVPDHYQEDFDFDEAYEEAGGTVILPRAKKEIFKTEDGLHNRLQYDMYSDEHWDKVRAELRAKGLDFAKTDFTYAKGDEYPNLNQSGAVEYLGKVLDILDDVGEPMTTQDWVAMIRPNSGSRETFLEAVLDEDYNAALPAIFDPKRWAGKTDEMKKLWSHVPRHYQNGFDFDDVYKEAAGDNPILPRAKKEIFDTQANGYHARLQENMLYARDWDTVRAELQAKGLDFAKTDFTYAKGDEYPNLAQGGVVGNLEKVLDILDEVGEPITNEDWLALAKPNSGSKETVLAAALDEDFDALGVIFQPRRWIGKIDEMKALWSHVPERYQDDFDFDEVYEEAGGQVTILPRAKKEIFDTDSDGTHDRLQNDMDSVEDWDKVRAELRAKGLDFAKTDFTYAKGDDYPNLTYLGVIQYLGKVLDILDDVGEPMTNPDWLADVKASNSTVLGEILREDAEAALPAIFEPRRWRGKADEMQELWSHVPGQYRDYFNFDDAYQKAQRITLRAATAQIQSADIEPGKMILSTAFTGVRYHPDRLRSESGEREEVLPGHMAINMPIKPREIVADAQASYTAGSRYMHVHARNPETARQSANPDDYARTYAGIRRHFPGILLSGPTSRKEDVGKKLDAAMAELNKLGKGASPEMIAKVELLRAKPAMDGEADMLTIFTEPDILSDNMLEGISEGKMSGQGRHHPDSIRHYFGKLAKKMNKRGMGFELEITHLQGLKTVETLVDAGYLNLDNPNKKVHAVVLMGFSQGLPIKKATFLEAMGRIDDLQAKTGLHFVVSVGAVIMPKDAATTPRDRGERLPEGKHDYREVIDWVVEYNEEARASGAVPVTIFRSGLEDTPVLYGVPQTNASLVEHVRDLLAEHGIVPEQDLGKVRELLTAPGPAAPAPVAKEDLTAGDAVHQEVIPAKTDQEWIQLLQRVEGGGWSPIFQVLDDIMTKPKSLDLLKDPLVKKYVNQFPSYRKAWENRIDELTANDNASQNARPSAPALVSRTPSHRPMAFAGPSP